MVASRTWKETVFYDSSRVLNCTESSPGYSGDIQGKRYVGFACRADGFLTPAHRRRSTGQVPWVKCSTTSITRKIMLLIIHRLESLHTPYLVPPREGIALGHTHESQSQCGCGHRDVDCSLVVFPVERRPQRWWPKLAHIDSITCIRQASHEIKWNFLYSRQIEKRSSRSWASWRLCG